MKRGVSGWVLVALFAVLLAHDVWEGVGNVLGMLQVGLQLGLQPNWYGWLILGADLLVPVVVFVIALLATRRRSFGAQLLIWLLAVVVSAVIGADVVLAGSDFSIIFPAV